MNERAQAKEQRVREAILNISDEPSQIDAIARIRGWFRPDEDSPFYAAVQKYLNGDVGLDQSVKEIIDPINKMVSANKSKDIKFLDLWYSILHSAKRIPFTDLASHTKLVNLLQAIKSHPEPHHQGEQGIYTALPAFGMAVRETWNDCPGVAAGYSTPEVHAWANINYFVALITKANVGTFWIYAVWAMRSALEQEWKDDGPEEEGEPNLVSQKYDATVPAASVWVFALGKALYEHEEDMTPTNRNQGNPAKGGKLWTGKSEISKARWAFWKKRFGEISNMEKASEETRRVAKEAVETMDKSES